MPHDQTLIDKFISVVSCTPEQAVFYLEASNWNLQSALASFYDNPTGDEELPPSYGTAQTSASALAGNLGPFLSGSGVNAFENEKNTRAAAAAQPPAPPSRSKPAKPQGRMRTLQDLVGDDSSDKDGESQNMFAGGKQSGMAVQNPGKKGQASDSLIDRILKKAAEQGSVSSEEEAPPKKKAFGGSGYRLGSEESAPTPSHPAVASVGSEVHEDNQEPINRVLTFWRNGFSVDDGPLLAYDDPANRENLELINSGRVPLALLNVRQGQHVDVRVAKRQDEDYVPPKVTVKPFSGEGQRLGSILPQISKGAPANTQAPPQPATSIPMLSVDPSQPISSLQIRLADGTRMVSKFNTTHTIKDVRNFVNASRPGESSRPYILQTTFPTKDLTDEKMTLQEAGLLNAVVVQRRT